MEPRRRRALLVDVGGVLLLLNTVEMVPIIARHGGVTTPEELYRAHSAAHNAAFPTHGEQLDYYAILPGFAGVPKERQQACSREYFAASCQRNMWHAPDAASKQTLQRFSDAGVKVAIVSQADGHIAEMLLDAEMCQVGPGPGVDVDEVFDSALVGLDKPDPRFFLHAVDGLAVSADEAVHVGDTVPLDVRGAEAAGILAVHYDPYGDCDAPHEHEHVRTLQEMERYLVMESDGNSTNAPAPPA